jgi:hypothetical protein
MGVPGGRAASERKNKRLHNGLGLSGGNSKGSHATSNFGTNCACSLLKATSQVLAAIDVSLIPVTNCIVSTVKSSRFNRSLLPTYAPQVVVHGLTVYAQRTLQGFHVARLKHRPYAEVSGDQNSEMASTIPTTSISVLPSELAASNPPLTSVAMKMFSGAFPWGNRLPSRRCAPPRAGDRRGLR